MATADGSTEVTPPPAPDHDEIVRVVQLYIRGFRECSVEKFREAFDQDAWIFYTDAAGNLYKHLVAESFDDWASPPGSNIVGRIISVTQAGDVASVLLGFDDPDDLADGWVDIHTLVRVDGVWKITNKTATHSSRAAWAAPTLS